MVQRRAGWYPSIPRDKIQRAATGHEGLYLDWTWTVHEHVKGQGWRPMRERGDSRKELGLIAGCVGVWSDKFRGCGRQRPVMGGDKGGWEGKCPDPGT